MFMMSGCKGKKEKNVYLLEWHIILWSLVGGLVRPHAIASLVSTVEVDC